MSKTLLVARMERAIDKGQPFTADDITADGKITMMGEHDPNGTQNGIGSLFREYAAKGLIRSTDRLVKSRAPHRKGGAIRVWEVVGDE